MSNWKRIGEEFETSTDQRTSGCFPGPSLIFFGFYEGFAVVSRSCVVIAGGKMEGLRFDVRARNGVNFGDTVILRFNFDFCLRFLVVVCVENCSPLFFLCV